MSIPNRQIGWSNESNLLWQISKQLEKLNGVVAATAAGGMLNPTTNFIPFNSGLAFGDSYLVNDTDILKTVWNTVDKGLKLDFLNEQYTLGRDGTEFLRVQTELIYTNYSGNDVGLKLDFANNVYKLGDVSLGLYADLANNIYYLGENAVNSDGFGLKVAIPNQVLLGDFGAKLNSTVFEIDNANQIIKTSNQGNDIGLKLDFANNQYYFGGLLNGSVGVFVQTGSVVIGDYDGFTNGTTITIDDANQKLVISANLQSATAGGSSGQYLMVNIGGTDYKIALLNNA